MPIVKCILMTIVLGLMLVGFQAQSSANSEIPQSFYTPTEKLMTGGQPSQAELTMLKSAGVTKVVNLRGPDEVIPYDEKAEVEALGMTYVSLPISGAADVTTENARELYELLQSDQQVFLHCASGNRVGALLAIGAHEIEGKSVEESLELGRSAGLGSLQKRVESIINDETKQ